MIMCALFKSEPQLFGGDNECPEYRCFTQEHTSTHAIKKQKEITVNGSWMFSFTKCKQKFGSFYYVKKRAATAAHEIVDKQRQLHALNA